MTQDANGMIRLNTLSAAFIALFAAAALTRYALSRLNIAHLRRYGHVVPEAFRDEIDAATLARMRDYTVESSRFHALESLADDAILLGFCSPGSFRGLRAPSRPEVSIRSGPARFSSASSTGRASCSISPSASGAPSSSRKSTASARSRRGSGSPIS